MDRNYKKYREFVIDNFKKFLDNEINNFVLNDNLHTIQNELGYNTQRRHRSVHFKFSKDDKYSYSINQIWSDFEFGKEVRKDAMREKLEWVIKNPKDLQINYN